MKLFHLNRIQNPSGKQSLLSQVKKIFISSTSTELPVDFLNKHLTTIVEKVITSDHAKEHDLQILKDYCESKRLEQSLISTTYQSMKCVKS